MKRKQKPTRYLSRFFVYLVLGIFAVTIIVPVAWVFMASVKENVEF